MMTDESVHRTSPRSPRRLLTVLVTVLLTLCTSPLVAQQPTTATGEAYGACGTDPSGRCRPSSLR